MTAIKREQTIHNEKSACRVINECSVPEHLVKIQTEKKTSLIVLRATVCWWYSFLFSLKRSIIINKKDCPCTLSSFMELREREMMW